MWSINVKFLRGVCVATSTGQWDESEWPPHPARLFMAMAAAYFETRTIEQEHGEQDHNQRAALLWLEQQAAPRIIASEAVEREPVTVFVPVNDSTRADQLFAESRSRQPRYFPTRIPDHDVVYFVFDGDLDASHVDSIKSIAGEVVRVGHSSSLTQVWIDEDFSIPTDKLDDGELNIWSPADFKGSGQPLRTFTDGMLDGLEAAYNQQAIEQYASLQVAISIAKGKEKSKLKTLVEEKFPSGAPASLRPQTAMTTAYQKSSKHLRPPVQSCFDSELMVLTFHEAPQIGLESTLQLAGAVRKRIHDAYPNRTSPEWLGGHKADGAPSNDPHLAIVPLPFVGRQHADGHLLGMAFAFPRHVAQRERATALRALFERSEEVDDWLLPLRLHQFRRLTGPESECDVVLVREQRLNPPQSLSARTWTASCTVWETVTPIVLDRFPKSDRGKEREGWLAEVAEIVSQSCLNIDLPEPAEVHVHHNAFVLGVSKARPSGGFPPMTGRDGKPSRYQVHARIEFSTPVQGPVILGAGRFVGYGFCRPNIRLCRERRRPQ